jgi:putative SOS response-associated peptidase YedK
MCYFNGQKVRRSESIRLKKLEKLVANYGFLNRDVVNGFDFGNTVVLKPVPGKEDFEIVEMEWGFLGDPSRWPFLETRTQANLIRTKHQDHNGVWMDGLDFLNAKGEELLFKNKVYRPSALERRCIILSTGYYDWRHVYHLNKRTGEPRKMATKYPYRIMLHGKEYFCIAGIWNPWTDYDTGEVVDTCSMVTTNGNFVTSQIHNSKSRQPTVLPDELALEWMFMKPDEKRITELATYDMPWENFQWYTLAKDFLSGNDPLKEFNYPNLAPIVLPGMEDFPQPGQMQLF